MNGNGLRDEQASDDLDVRIRSALNARAGQVVEPMLRPVDPSRPVEGRSASAVPRPWAAPLLAAAAVAALAVATSAVAHGSGSHRAGVGTSTRVTTPHLSVPTPFQSSQPPAPSRPTATASTRSAPTGSAAPTPTTAGVFELGYEPLWPFATEGDVAAWQAAYQRSGTAPWHLDSGQTALLFTRNYLGFTELTTITSTAIDGSGARIGIGYVDPTGVTRTAAVLHLVRFGSIAQAPWEVVGSDDTSLSLDQPAYGSSVGSLVAIGGHITGVDEAIRVSVQSLATGAARLLAMVPAGGTQSPWSTGPVDLHLHGVLTIVAATGGHLQQVERFAIQGVTAS